MSKAEIICAIFLNQAISTMKEMEASCGRSRASILNYLASFGYLVSYNGAGKYYTLTNIPCYDSNGIWKCGQALFSKHGSLKNTIIALVNESARGYSHNELSTILGIKLFNTLRDLVKTGKIKRFGSRKNYIYYNATQTEDEIIQIRAASEQAEAPQINTASEQAEAPQINTASEQAEAPQINTASEQAEAPQINAVAEPCVTPHMVIDADPYVVPNVGLYETIRVLEMYINGIDMPLLIHYYMFKNNVNVTFEQTISIFNFYNLIKITKMLLGELQSITEILNHLKKLIKISAITACTHKITAPAEVTVCAICGAKMTVSKTVRRGITSLQLGFMETMEQHRSCPNGCLDPKTGKVVQSRSSLLASLVKPGCNFAYDVECHIGVQVFIYKRQITEVLDELRSNGINISDSEAQVLSHRFLFDLEKLHFAKAEFINNYLKSHGGYMLHIDSTCEAGTGGTFAAVEGMHGWVMIAGKAETEFYELIYPILEKSMSHFGMPLTIERDMGQGMHKAIVQALLDKTERKPVELVCHFHIGKDTGCDTLSEDHRALIAFFRDENTRKKIHNLIKKTSEFLEDKDLGSAISEWEKSRILHDSWEGVCVIRSLMQYILDFKYDKSGKLFPFTRPYLVLYNRCCEIYNIIIKELNDQKHIGTTEYFLKQLKSILEPVASSKKAKMIVKSLNEKAIIFDEFREVLRLDTKGGYISRAGETAPDEKSLSEMKSALDDLVDKFKLNRDTMNKNQKKAVDIILKHIEKHGQFLWGHRIVVQDENGKEIVLYAYRTNNIIEVMWRNVKKGLRRRIGCGKIGHIMEHLPASLFYTANLMNKEYINVVLGGSLDNLPKLFAQNDAENKVPIVADSKKKLARGSLPRSQKAIIRSENFIQKVAENSAEPPLQPANQILVS
jgi:hypothetical protein